jgi:hypothetical protein
MKDKIFISHSSEDVEIVELFIDKVLKLGLGILQDRIFCTSMEGHRVSGGQYIPDRLKAEIHKASLVFLFISKSYKTSEVCLNELGAAWVTLDKGKVIPVLLPDIDFKDLGFLDIKRLGIKLSSKSGILGLIDDNKTLLNNSFKLSLVTRHVEEFIQQIEGLNKKKETNEIVLSPEQLECKNCFEDSLEPFHDVLVKCVPSYSDGIYQITEKVVQNKLWKTLGEANFLGNLWYLFADGDFYVKCLRMLTNGSWLMTKEGWEFKVSEMWISIDVSNQNEFILIKAEALPAFKINSDVGGSDYRVGILSDGTITSEAEFCNGYAIIGGDTIDLNDHDAKLRCRERNSHWIFLATGYHKVGHNADETIKYCSKLDSGEIDLTDSNLKRFVRSLNNEPTVLRWR